MLRLTRFRLLCALSVLLVLLGRGGIAWTETVGPTFDASNETGVTRLFSSAGPVEIPHPFGQSLGNNGRMCVTCHSPFDGMSIIPANVRARFDATGGPDPIFLPNDGSNPPNPRLSITDPPPAAFKLP